MTYYTKSSPRRTQPKLPPARKPTLILVALLIMVLAIFPSCDEKKEIPTTGKDGKPLMVHTEQDMGFSVALDQDLYNMVTIAKGSIYDENIKMDKAAITLYTEIAEKNVPLVTINMYEQVFSKAKIEKLNPMMVYVGKTKTRTYTLFYSEEADGLLSEEELPAYNKIMNDYVAGMEDRIAIFE